MAPDVAPPPHRQGKQYKTAIKHPSLRYCVLRAERTAEAGCGQFYEKMGEKIKQGTNKTEHCRTKAG